MYDLERLKREFYEACESQGMELKIPVSINGRLTRTLGRVRYFNSYQGVVLRDVEFSKELLETASDQSIRDVLLHEAAHAIVTFKTGVKHGHDKVFKNMCHKLGTTNDGTTTDVDRVVDKKTKYTIWCPVCANQWHYSRSCNVVKNAGNCTCPKCNHFGLGVKQNW